MKLLPDGQTQSSPTWSLSKDIALHWIFCNVYPKSPNSIQFTVEKLWDDLKYLGNYDNKKKNDSYWKRYDKFVEKVHLVPDLIESDVEIRKVHEKLWNCKMNENDKSFHKLQLQDPRTGYCSTFVDKKWKKHRNGKNLDLIVHAVGIMIFLLPKDQMKTKVKMWLMIWKLILHTKLKNLLR